MDEIYRYKSYKAFLQSVLGGKHQRRGLKSGLAKALRCQPTYISQVMHGRAEFSLEQGEQTARFLGLDRGETKYFLFLIQSERAGTAQLKILFREELKTMRERRLILKERLGLQKSLSKEQQATYYSSWQYAAVHIALTIPELRSRESLSRYLGIKLARVNQIMKFLSEAGLAQEREGQLFSPESQLRLGNDSENIIKHHTNWRLRALHSLENEQLEEMHYSAAVSLSREDIPRLKDLILKGLQQQLTVVRESKEEELYCYVIDFFSLRDSR
jgi:uncharacterized protein (TIGR02147 family)